MKFVFLLTIWTAQAPVPEVYVVDAGLTGEQCIAAMVQYDAIDPTHAAGTPSCEIDFGDEGEI